MSEKTVPAGKWKLRPFDPKCKTFVDHDPGVEDQIRCKVPAWTGDFGEVVPEVIAQGVSVGELPLVTVHQIGQFVIRAAQGGSLRCGTVCTAAHDIGKETPLASAADDALYNWAADALDDEHWQILEVCGAKFFDRATAESEETITSWVVGGAKPARGVLPDMKRQFNFLKQHKCNERKKGVGTWLSQQGAGLLGARKARLNRLLVV